MLTGLMCCTVLAGYVTLRAAQAEYKIVSAIKLAFYAAQSKASNPQLSATQTTRLLKDIREGIAINPHYRKLTPAVADTLAASGDWRNAIWIWESVATSRPNVAVIWLNIARGYTHLGQNDRAMAFLQRAQKLQDDAPGLRALEIVLLSRTDHAAQAKHMLTGYFDQSWYDLDMVQAGYAVGLETHDWPLAIRSLELRNQHWPEQAADAFMRLGKIYADPEVADDTKALAAFRAGLQAVPADQKQNYRTQVPEAYRAGL
jgi:tetratricopeptide (TPR) repeat protein